MAKKSISHLLEVAERKDVNKTFRLAPSDLERLEALREKLSIARGKRPSEASVVRSALRALEEAVAGK